jgi:phosphoribosylglycinamide formyltransferase-1
MRILSADFLARFPGRVVNTHPALLPASRARTPVADALAYGVRVSGVTVHFVDEGVDTGPGHRAGRGAVLEDDDEACAAAQDPGGGAPLYVEAVGRLARQGWTVEGRTVRLG